MINEGREIIPNKHQLNQIYMDLFGWLGESTRINEDRGKSRNPKAILLIYKRISKGLGCIFRRFREIRNNLTEDQGINQKFISSLIRSPFMLGKRFALIFVRSPLSSFGYKYLHFLTQTGITLV